MLAARVVEVITDLGVAAVSRYRYGSGCIVRGRTVLTAAHVVAGAVSVAVRDPAKREYTATVDPRFVGDPGGPGPDLALVEIDDPAFDRNLPAIGLAAIDRDSGEPVERCHAVGYPWFAETRSRTRTAVRDTVDAIGVVPVLSKLATGLLSVQVTVAPRALPPQKIALEESEWSGMSGAPVFAAGCLLGVVTEHAPREGPSAVTAVPLTALQADPSHEQWGPGVADLGAWWSRLGVGGIGDLQRLPVPPPPRQAPAYRANLQDFGRTLHRRMPQLLGRDRELVEIAAFATGAEGYRWLVGGAFTGKSALLYEAVTVGLPDQVDVVYYFLSRRATDASSDRFLAAVVPQLAYLCDKDPPTANVDEYHALWAQAAGRAAKNRRHLLLVVDGLDEDLRPRGSPSVASLLPTLVGGHAHVLVTSRLTELPHGVPAGHPLATANQKPVDPFKGSEELADLAQQEIDDLLDGPDADLAAEVLGPLTAAAGALSMNDLATLSSNDLVPPSAARTRQVRQVVTKAAARSLELVGFADQARYQFAHASLLEYAQKTESLRDPEYRDRIHRWAEQWREAGWPTSTDGTTGTPRYLFDSYPAALSGDPDRLAALAGDVGWVATALSVAGVDRVLADLRTAAAEAPPLAMAAAMLGVVSTQTTNLRPPRPADHAAYVLRQLCLQAMEFGEDNFANAAQTRLRTLPDPGPVPLWTTRRARNTLAIDLGAHRGGVSAMAALGARRVVTGGDDGRVLVWDPANAGADPVELGAHQGPLSAIAVLGGEGVLFGANRLWLAGHGYPDQVEEINRAVSGGNDRRVVTGGDDGRVLVWDPDAPGAGQVELGAHRGPVSALAVLAARRVVTGGDDGRVLVWDPDAPGAGPVELGAHQGKVSAMAVSGDRWGGTGGFDRRVVTGGDDGRVLVWDPDAPGAGPVDLGAHHGPVSALAVLRGGWVVTGGDDGRVLVWSPHAPGAGPVELGAHQGKVSAMAVSGDRWGGTGGFDRRVVTGGDDGRVLVWDPDAPGAGPVDLGAHHGPVSALAVLGASRVVTGGDDGRVLVWGWGPYDALSEDRKRTLVRMRAYAPGAGLVELGAHPGPVSALAVLGASRVVTGGDDGRVLVWDPDAPGADLVQLGTHHGRVSAPAVLDDGRVVTGGDDGRVLVWDPANAGADPVELGAHRGPVPAVAVLDDGRIVTGGKRPRVLVWDPRAPGVGPVELGKRHGQVSALAVLDDGRVVTGGDDGRVLVWNPDRPRLEPVDLGPQQRKGYTRRHRRRARLGAVAVLHDGRVVTGGDDGRVLVWDPDTPGVGPVELGTHGDSVRAVAVSGGRVVTGGDDGRVLVWDPDTPGVGPVELGTHGDSVRAVAVPGGRVVTGGDDRRVLVWDLDKGEKTAEIGCSVYGLATCQPSAPGNTQLVITHAGGLSGWSMSNQSPHE